MTSRARSRLAGGLVVLLYLGGALWSAHLSPFARRPLLDSVLPVEPYRWVNPPPHASATNKPPTPGTFLLTFGPGGIRGGAFATQDVQVTVIVPHDGFAPRPGQRSVKLTVDPLDPATLGPTPHSLVALGNAIRIRATYAPSSAPARPSKPLEVVLVYPFVPTDSGEHVLLTSTDGTSWKTVRATDRVASAQLLGQVTGLGYVLAAGKRGAPRPSPTPSPSAPSNTGTLIGITVGAVVVLVVIALVFGRRPASGSRARS